MHSPLGTHLDRRTFLKTGALGIAGAGTLLTPRRVGAFNLFVPDKSRVSLVTGSDRREMAIESMKPFEDEIGAAIEGKQVVIKPNIGQVNSDVWLNATDVNQLRGILDFLAPMYERTIIIGEGTATAQSSTFVGYENFGYLALEKEYDVKLVDLNDTPTTMKMLVGWNQHPMPVNIIDTYLDPDVYLISATRFKNSGGVLVTLSGKNIAMGAPVHHYKQKTYQNRNEKTLIHSWKGLWSRKGQSLNIFLMTAMGIQPDLAVLDGVLGMEGNGPVNGTPIEHGVALASTDWLAADRLGLEMMGYDHTNVKYLQWAGEAGFGKYDLGGVDVLGPDYRDHIKRYRKPDNYDDQIAWILEDEKIAAEQADNS